MLKRKFLPVQKQTESCREDDFTGWTLSLKIHLVFLHFWCWSRLQKKELDSVAHFSRTELEYKMFLTLIQGSRNANYGIGAQIHTGKRHQDVSCNFPVLCLHLHKIIANLSFFPVPKGSLGGSWRGIFNKDM